MARSTSRARAATAAVSSEALVSSRRKTSHCLGPSTLDDPRAGDLQWRRGLLKIDDERPLRPVPMLQLVEPTVPDQVTVVDDQQAGAEPLDVCEVVCRQEHGDAALAVDLRKEFAHGRARHHVEPDRGLVEEDDVRLVQERRGQLAAHALPQRELPHGCCQERPEIEGLRKPIEARSMALGRHAVDVPQQVERVGERQVPPELRALAEDDADPACELDPLPRRI